MRCVWGGFGHNLPPNATSKQASEGASEHLGSRVNQIGVTIQIATWPTLTATLVVGNIGSQVTTIHTLLAHVVIKPTQPFKKPHQL